MAKGYKEQCKLAAKLIEAFAGDSQQVMTDILVYCDSFEVAQFEKVLAEIKKKPGYFGMCETVALSIDWPLNAVSPEYRHELWAEIQPQKHFTIRKSMRNGEVYLECDMIGRRQYNQRIYITHHLETEEHKITLELLKADLLEYQKHICGSLGG